MIIEIILTSLMNIIKSALSVVDLPDMPSSIIDAIQQLLVYLYQPIELTKWLIGPEFLITVSGLMILYWLAHPIIHTSLFIYRLIRG